LAIIDFIMPTKCVSCHAPKAVAIVALNPKLSIDGPETGRLLALHQYLDPSA
jgi:hypothetical protein